MPRSQTGSPVCKWCNCCNRIKRNARHPAAVMLVKPCGRDLSPCVGQKKGSVLSVTTVSQYLAVWVDGIQYIEHLSEKCAQATWRLWRHGQSLTIRVRKTFYIFMILSPGIYAWNSFSHILSKTLVFHVEKMVKVGIRAVFRVKHHTATMPPRLCLNVKPSAQLYQK